VACEDASPPPADEFAVAASRDAQEAAVAAAAPPAHAAAPAPPVVGGAAARPATPPPLAADAARAATDPRFRAPAVATGRGWRGVDAGRAAVRAPTSPPDDCGGPDGPPTPGAATAVAVVNAAAGAASGVQSIAAPAAGATDTDAGPAVDGAWPRERRERPVGAAVGGASRPGAETAAGAPEERPPPARAKEFGGSAAESGAAGAVDAFGAAVTVPVGGVGRAGGEKSVGGAVGVDPSSSSAEFAAKGTAASAPPPKTPEFAGRLAGRDTSTTPPAPACAANSPE